MRRCTLFGHRDGSLFTSNCWLVNGTMINRHLVIGALTMALDSRMPEGQLILHSDRGTQYTSDDFRDQLVKHGIQCSMSGRGNCYDNAVVESFFGLLKREWVN